MRFQQLSWLFVLAFGLVSCSAQATTPAPALPSATFSPTGTPTETVTPFPSITSTATFTPQPAFVSTPIPAVENPITAENAKNLTKLAEWGHGQANFITYSPDGKLLAIAATTGIYFYNAKTLADAGSIQTSDIVNGIAFSHDGSLLTATFERGAVQIWQMADRSLLKTLERETGLHAGIPIFALDDNLLVSGSVDGAARLWRVSDGKLLRTFRGSIGNDQGRVNAFSMALSPDGSLLATEYPYEHISVWNISNGSLVKTFPGKYVSFSPDGSLLTLSALDNSGQNPSTQLWQVVDWTLLRTLNKQQGETDTIQFSPDGKMLITTDRGGDAKLWNVSDGMLLKTLSPDYRDRFAFFAFSPDNETLAFISHAGRIQTREIVHDTNRTMLFGFMNIVYSVAFSPDHTLVATGDDAFIQVWKISDGALIDHFENGETQTLAFSPDGKVIAAGTILNGLRLWDLATKKVITLGHKESIHNESVYSLAFSPNGKLLAVGTSDRVEVWDVASQQSMGAFKINFVETLTFSPDSKILAVGEYQQVELWQVAEKRVLRKIKNNSYAISDIKFSKDGTQLLVTGDLVSILWDIQTGEPLANLALRGETFSPDLSILTSTYQGEWNAGAPRGQVILWQFPDGKKITSLKLDAQVSDTAYSPDGNLLAFALRNGTIQIWGVK